MANNKLLNTLSKNANERNGKRAAKSEKGLLVKNNDLTGRFIDSKSINKPFKGVRKEALDKLGNTLARLAKYDKQ